MQLQIMRRLDSVILFVFQIRKGVSGLGVGEGRGVEEGNWNWKGGKGRGGRGLRDDIDDGIIPKGVEPVEFCSVIEGYDACG